MSGAVRVALFAMALCAAFGLPGCASDPTVGYSASGVWSEPGRTVGVSVFENATFHAGLEADLTEALIKELRARTPWPVTDPSMAVATLTGTIREVRLVPLSTRRGTGLVEEMAVEMRVDFDFVDRRRGKTIVARRGFSTSGTFAPARPAGERLEAGEAEAIARLARDIVSELRSGW